jgi:phosphoribosylaminoimidazole (AIR) synthetase
MTAVFESARWDEPLIMTEIVKRSDLGFEERYRTFNMGVGYTLILGIADVGAALAAVPGARVVGFVQPRADGEPRVIVRPRRP